MAGNELKIDLPDLYDEDDLGLNDVDSFRGYFKPKKPIGFKQNKTFLANTSKFDVEPRTADKSLGEVPPGFKSIPLQSDDRKNSENGDSSIKINWQAAALSTVATAACEAAASASKNFNVNKQLDSPPKKTDTSSSVYSRNNPSDRFDLKENSDRETRLHRRSRSRSRSSSRGRRRRRRRSFSKSRSRSRSRQRSPSRNRSRWSSRPSRGRYIPRRYSKSNIVTKETGPSSRIPQQRHWDPSVDVAPPQQNFDVANDDVDIPRHRHEFLSSREIFVDEINSLENHCRDYFAINAPPNVSENPLLQRGDQNWPGTGSPSPAPNQTNWTPMEGSGYIPGPYATAGATSRMEAKSYTRQDSPAHCHWMETEPPRVHWEPPSQSPMAKPEETHAQIALKLAVEKEALQQKMTFDHQRKEYLQKREVLVEELTLLKNQKRDLSSNKSPEVLKVIDANLTLQDEVISKVKAVDNVLDMLTGLIGDNMRLPTNMIKERSPSPKKKKRDSKKKRSRSNSTSSSSSSSGSESDNDRKRKRKSKKHKKRSGSRSPGKGYSKSNAKEKEEIQRYNLAFFDPEIHWCQPCKVFPPTAKQYLLHLHSADHRKAMQDIKLSDLPWHDLNDHEELPTLEGLPSIRTPIKGLEFFVAATAWFCKLCNSWMGDLHCASSHLKCIQHNKNYQEFIKKNGSWESEWLSQREKAMMLSASSINLRQLEEKLTVHRNKQEELKRMTVAANELLMPLKLNNKRKEKGRKIAKKSDRKRRDYSSQSSSSSNSSSSSSSSDDSRRKHRKKKGELLYPVVEKSKWEREEEEEEDNDNQQAPVAFKKTTNTFRNYRGLGERKLPQFEVDFMPKPPSPPNINEAVKHPEKHTILIPESLKLKEPFSLSTSKTLIEKTDSDDSEPKFEKQTFIAATKKPSVPPTLPKTKFAFIGRMPFARKKPEPSESSKKEQDVATPDPTPPPPPVISKKLIKPKEMPTPVLTNKTKIEVAKDILTKSQAKIQHYVEEPQKLDPVVMDMDIENPLESPPSVIFSSSPPPLQKPHLPPEVTKNLGRKIMAIPLPKEFQEALSIIYPEETPPPPPPAPRAETPQPPPPPPPLLGDYSVDSYCEIPPAPSPPRSFELVFDRPSSKYNDEDEMALLGIEKEDMAAQRF